MTVDIRILAQAKENYGWHEGAVQWKMKGCTEFIIEGVPDSVMYYSQSEMDQAISAILRKRSNDHFAYELISWELIFGQPTQVSADEFDEQIQSLKID